MANANKSKKPKRRFSAFGSLDKKTRRWAYLGSVRQSGGTADGDDLVFKANATTLEVGQGVSNLRGWLWPAGLAGFITSLAISALMLFVAFRLGHLIGLPESQEPLSMVAVFGALALLCVLAPVGLLAGALALNDLFGPIDVPIRFDRARRKVYVWATRKEGPMVLDWDAIQSVAQSVGAPPYQVNQFRSVLLVDEDEDGDVRFEGKLPRIAQIGAALLNREATLGAYEYVRRFMESGPQALPPVKRYLVMRPRGWRSFVDVLGLSQTFMRSYPSLPKHQRKPGWLLFGVLAVALFSVILVPLQIAQGIAVKFTTRVPKWPQSYEDMAALGGPMQPPPGAEPNDLPLLPHERLIVSFWLASAVVTWGVLIAGA